MQSHCRINDKRGIQITLSAVIGIVIGVIAVVILFNLGANMFYLLVPTSQEELQAKGTLQDIKELAYGLTFGETKSLKIENPQGWWIVGFDKEKKTLISTWLGNKESQRPATCEKEHCICICKKSTNCVKNAACIDVKKPLYKGGEPAFLKIEFGIINITNHDNFYEISV